ncbi:type VII secretion system-associated protein [Streptomyces pristinaespiralis]|uniref:type VII secretion system-associated protein n=1 Tax=Streptomyces pristinaespiralis TaxID=38300 RepID=UPI00383606C4
MTDLTQLDAAHLQTFIDTEVADFDKDLVDIGKDVPKGARALKSLVEGYHAHEGDHLQENPYLAIGLMAAEGGLVKGNALVSRVADAAKGIVDVLTAEQNLFKHIARNLEETIKVLQKNQDQSLTAISAEKMLDLFSDVDNDLSGTPASDNSTSKAA